LEENVRKVEHLKGSGLYSRSGVPCAIWVNIKEGELMWVYNDNGGYIIKGER